MRPIKRDLLHISAMSAFVLALALTLGIGTAHAQAPATPQQPDQATPQQPQEQQSAQSKTFTGTIVKSGTEFALRDSSGKMYKLDNSDQAKTYEGKTVKVTGQLDEQAMTIHVESIEGSEG